MSSLVRYYCFAAVIFLAILFYNVFFYVTYKADICKTEVPVDEAGKEYMQFILWTAATAADETAAATGNRFLIDYRCL